MRPSHICPDCATELAHERAFVDQSLGLRLVACPRCERTHVRIPHQDAQFWRSTRNLLRTLGSLMLRLVLLGAAAFAFAIVCLMLGYGFFQPEDPSALVDEQDRLPIALVVLVMAVLMVVPGLITRLVLTHHTPNRSLGLLVLGATCWLLYFEYQNLYWCIDMNSMNLSLSNGYILLIDAPQILIAMVGGMALVSALMIRLTDWLHSRFHNKLPSAWVRRRRRFRRRERRIRERGYAS
ncbi:MAG: hypothetical protein R3B67_08685 [Phycisphaerales bacterium]